MSDIRRHVLDCISDFCERTGMSERRLGVEAVNDPHLVRRVRLGYGTQLSTLERVEAYMAAEMERRALTVAEAA